jgi:UDP-glucose 4-epimerase
MANRENVLLIGGFGFIGSNILDRFLAGGKHDLIVFEFTNVRPKHPEHPHRCKVYYGDFNNIDDLETVFRENRIDVVVHLISTTVPASSNANIPFDIQSNLLDSVRLLDLMLKYGSSRIVYLSSGGTVYGEPKSIPIKEEDHTDPICSYGITKLAIEKYLHLYSHLHGLSYLVLRPSNPYGPYHTSTKQGLVNVALRKALAGEPITIWGDGHVVRDYMYVADLAEAAYQLIERGNWGTIVNIGHGEGHSVRQVLAAIGAECPGMQVTYQASRNFDIENLVLDTSRMRSLCDLRLTGLAEGLRRTADWLRQPHALPG